MRCFNAEKQSAQRDFVRRRITILLLGVLGLIQCAQAYVVHLVQQVEVDGAIVETIDQIVETGDGYTKCRKRLRPCKACTGEGR